MCFKRLQRRPDRVLELANSAVAKGGSRGVVKDILRTAALAANLPSVKEPEELVRRRTHAIPSGEETLNAGHFVVAPKVFRRRQVLRAADPGASLAGVRPHDVGLEPGRFPKG